MQVFDGVRPLPPEFHNAVVAIGNFDGLHRGHQQLLAIAADLAKSRCTAWGIVTFEPHPRTYFKPDEPIFRLTPPALKARLAQALGASFLVEIAFDKPLSNLGAAEFVKLHLVDKMKAAHVVTGYDFHFGKGRTGNPMGCANWAKQTVSASRSSIRYRMKTMDTLRFHPAPSAQACGAGM
jgi:riboflavin kinase / FMN adenylyltransferase